MLTAVQWVRDPRRKSGKDSFGVEYERVDGTVLTALRISPGKRYRMRNLDWIVSGDRFLRRVAFKEMGRLYICKKDDDGKTVITLKPGAAHPWVKLPPDLDSPATLTTEQSFPQAMGQPDEAQLSLFDEALEPQP